MAAHRRASAVRPEPLPTFYYHDHFVELLSFVERHYVHALFDEHRRFIDDFAALSKPAQCLYVRLVNRKGRAFARRRLRYPEIGSLDAPLGELENNGWIGPPEADHWADVAAALTRDELLALLMPDVAGLGRRLKKSDYLREALRHPSPAALLSRLDFGNWFVQRRQGAVRYLIYLYFGHLPDGLEKFTMRDLGLTRVQRFTDEFEPRFESREEAAEHFFFAERLNQLRTTDTALLLERMSADSDSWPAPAYDGSERLRDELAFKLGRAAERAKRPEDALRFYERAASASCTERRVRCLITVGRTGEAKTVLEACLARAGEDPRWLFAADLHGRTFGGKRTTPATDALKAARTIELDESWCGAAERGVVEWYGRKGDACFRVENSLWRTLFGLVFWDELFGASASELHSPFEWRPKSLSNGRFYRQHAALVEAKLTALADPGRLLHDLLGSSTRHYGTQNGVFRWRRQTLDALFALVRHIDPAALAAPLRRLARRFDDYCHGYPDLLVISDDVARFVEVKAEGDQLRPNQLRRLEELKKAGFEVEVLRVAFNVDPAQDYVVVDVETTGGRGQQHRITEFAAVRMRDGQIVDRFQSLINPCRGIPPAITRLTGISQQMVEDAPFFDEVIDKIDEFTRDAIFVAHNVGFDYRFVRQEFARFGRHFRRPRLCTCTQMRKLYPGFESYSLASLCERFSIPLAQHHRALCDAEAAAELLVLVNERRLAGATR